MAGDVHGGPALGRGASSPSRPSRSVHGVTQRPRPRRRRPCPLGLALASYGASLRSTPRAKTPTDPERPPYSLYLGFPAWLSWAAVRLQFLGQSSHQRLPSVGVDRSNRPYELPPRREPPCISQRRRAAVRSFRNANPRARGSRLAALPWRTGVPNSSSSRKPLRRTRRNQWLKSMEFGIVVALRQGMGIGTS